MRGLGNARPGQNAMHGLAAEVNAFPLAQQLGQVSVVGASVGGAGQLDYRSCLVVRNGVAGSTASVPVSKCGGALLAIVRQNSPGMAFTHPQDLGSLGYRQLVFQNGVEHVESRLFDGVQCQVLHRLTFSLDR